MREHRRQRGAAALEFAFIAPVLILLLAGVVTLGLAAMAKFRMSDAALGAARGCAVTGVATCGQTATAYVNGRWTDGARACGGGAQTTFVVANNVVTITVRCAFTGGVLQGFLGLGNMNIVTSAAMPL